MANALEHLLADLGSEEFQFGVVQRFWELTERVDMVAYLRMFAPDDRVYLLRADCATYGDEPIRGQFVEPVSRQSVASEWPTGNPPFDQWVKFKPGELFICWDQDKEGIKRHSEWRNRAAWKRKGNQIVAYLDFIRQLLHLPMYGYHRRN
jgi:hypothetical protein